MPRKINRGGGAKRATKPPRDSKPRELHLDQELLLTVEARALIRVSRPQFDRLRKVDGFPKPLLLGTRSHRWRRAELLAWADSKRAVA
jgi:predicted DNA-binding transcriptional regulator AlpA